MSSTPPITPNPVAGERTPSPSTSPTPARRSTDPAPPGPPSITIENFCVHLSAADKRVELIGAFHNAESAAKHYLDTQDNYQERFTAFCSAPA